LDRSRLSVSNFSKIKDSFKEDDISLLKGPVANLEKQLSEKSKSLLGDDLLAYLNFELSNPFKDPRKPYRVFSFSKSIESVEDVKEDHLYWGIVTKFSTFGAFVDIGVGTDGLVHLSELSNDYVADARKVLRLGQWVLIKAIKVDQKAKKLSFSKTKAEPTSRKEGSSSRKKFAKSSSKRPPHKGKAGFNKNGNKPQAGQKRGPKKPFNNPFAALKDLK
jgi:uncharacterized protein